jgi:hypothetical protein
MMQMLRWDVLVCQVRRARYRGVFLRFQLAEVWYLAVGFLRQVWQQSREPV